MSSTKKVPVVNAKKKVTVLARAKTNTGAAKRTSDNNGSYIQDTTKKNCK